MARRRILSVALPHLGAEYHLRREGLAGFGRPFAIAGQDGGALRLTSVNRVGAEAGLAPGMALADARAICPALATRPAEPERLAAFRRALARWAGQFSPLVGLDMAEAGAGALVLDATGVAHLFGGEEGMLAAVLDGLAGLGLGARAALADTRGAAWALAHFGRTSPAIAPPGQGRAALAPLPVAALRLAPGIAETLAGTGLATVGDLAGVARAPLARRFGIEVMRRLDQALGAEPEPVSALAAAPVFAARLTLPEPIGLVPDVMAGLDRLLERVCQRLERAQMGARALRLDARRVDGADQTAVIRLARPLRDPVRLRALFLPKVETIEAGFGIDALRLAAVETEPLGPRQLGPRQIDPGPSGPGQPGEGSAGRRLPRGREPDAALSGAGLSGAGLSDAGSWGERLRGAGPSDPGWPGAGSTDPGCSGAAAGRHRQGAGNGAGDDERLADLVSRIGNRIGFEAVIRFLPAESHIPERAFTLAAAAWSTPGRWPSEAIAVPRPLTLFPPEPVTELAPAQGTPAPPPARFRWRGRTLSTLNATGPERLAPEWWWDDPAWRSGTRDYWRVETAEGPRLWLFHTPQADWPGWQVQGEFA